MPSTIGSQATVLTTAVSDTASMIMPTSMGSTPDQFNSSNMNMSVHTFDTNITASNNNSTYRINFHSGEDEILL